MLFRRHPKRLVEYRALLAEVHALYASCGIDPHEPTVAAIRHMLETPAYRFSSCEDLPAEISRLRLIATRVSKVAREKNTRPMTLFASYVYDEPEIFPDVDDYRKVIDAYGDGVDKYVAAWYGGLPSDRCGMIGQKHRALGHRALVKAATERYDKSKYANPDEAWMNLIIVVIEEALYEHAERLSQLHELLCQPQHLTVMTEELLRVKHQLELIHHARAAQASLTQEQQAEDLLGIYADHEMAVRSSLLDDIYRINDQGRS